MKVGFTGTERGMTRRQKIVVQSTLIAKNPTEVHHGDCVGADKEFHDIATMLSIHTVAHPPIKERLRAFCKADEIRKPKPYLVRNKDIVAECDYLIAAPHEYKEVVRSGTWATIRAARRSHTPHGIIYPGASSP